ncbi:MAG: hypothetical protein J5J06_04565 [Phycisphaerae bacterium]|nr:hypothetical protein [Phycisphaerae bacterium]
MGISLLVLSVLLQMVRLCAASAVRNAIARNAPVTWLASTINSAPLTPIAIAVCLLGLGFVYKHRDYRRWLGLTLAAIQFLLALVHT